MPAPVNAFKAAIADGPVQIGCWLSFAETGPTEIMGTAGFDWLVVDSEHAPNDIRSIRDQLIALHSSPSHSVVRVPIGETWIIKQALDVGAQTILVPMVESAEQARELVRAVTYPPHGNRGVGAATVRASRFSSIPDYVTTASQQICLLVQVENRAGLAALDDILAVDGIDGVFIGPADLAADLGHLGNSNHPEVLEVIHDVIRRTAAAGKAPGILWTGDDAQQFVESGVRFLAVGLDVQLLIRTARETAARWKP